MSPPNTASGALDFATFASLHPLACLGSLLLLACLAVALVHTAYGRLQAHARRRPGEWPTLDFVRVAFAAAVVAAAIGVFMEMTEGMVAKDAIAVFDTRLAETLSRSLSSATLAAFATVTHLGDPATLVCLGVAVAGLLLWQGHRRWTLAWLVATGGNAALNPLLKLMFERSRPVHDHGHAVADGFSFPSGHSSGSLVVYGMLAWVLLQFTPQRWHLALVLGATLFAVTVACSRVMLQVHWASDVVAGLASGTAWLTVCVAAAEWSKRRDVRRLASAQIERT